MSLWLLLWVDQGTMMVAVVIQVGAADGVRCIGSMTAAVTTSDDSRSGIRWAFGEGGANRHASAIAGRRCRPGNGVGHARTSSETSQRRSVSGQVARRVSTGTSA